MELHVQGYKAPAPGIVTTRCGKKKKKEVTFVVLHAAGGSRLLKPVPPEEAQELHRRAVDIVLPVARPPEVFASSLTPAEAQAPIVIVSEPRPITVVSPSRIRGNGGSASSCTCIGFGKEVQCALGHETRKNVRYWRTRQSDRKRGKRNGSAGPCGKAGSWKTGRSRIYQFGWYV